MARGQLRLCYDDNFVRLSRSIHDRRYDMCKDMVHAESGNFNENKFFAINQVPYSHGTSDGQARVLSFLLPLSCVNGRLYCIGMCVLGEVLVGMNFF